VSEIITKEKYSRLLEEFSSLKKDNEELLNKVKVLSEEVFWLKKELFASRSERRPIKEKNTEEIDLFEKAEEKRSEVATESTRHRC
jgi:cell division septum initiation protein DivIVA